MSSVNFKKNTTSGGRAMIGHFTRHDGQEVDYRNKYIDKGMSAFNYCIGNEEGKIPTAKEISDKLVDRIKAIDEVQPPKRKVQNRITIMTYTIAAPKEITLDKEGEFFKMAYDEIARMSGGRENISVGFVHTDEEHDYIDTDGERRSSRVHLHVAGIPYTPEKGVNGKAFETKSRMIDLNKAIDERCRKELGIKFMTGEKGLTGRTVEELQAMSETKAKRQARNRINMELEEHRQENRELKAENDRVRDSVERGREICRTYEKNAQKLDESVRKSEKELAELRKEIGDLQRIRQFALDRIRAIAKTAKKVLSPFERLRELVESGRRNAMHENDYIGLQRIDFQGGGCAYAPVVRETKEPFSWEDKIPLYAQEKDYIEGFLSPAYIMEKDGRCIPSRYDKWAETFSHDKRDTLEIEKDNPSRYVLSEQLQREVDSCKSVIADIDRVSRNSLELELDDELER